MKDSTTIRFILTLLILFALGIFQMYTSIKYQRELNQSDYTIDSLMEVESLSISRFDSVVDKNRELNLKLKKYDISLYIYRLIDSCGAQSFEQVLLSNEMNSIK